MNRCKLLVLDDRSMCERDKPPGRRMSLNGPIGVHYLVLEERRARTLEKKPNGEIQIPLPTESSAGHDTIGCRCSPLVLAPEAGELTAQQAFCSTVLCRRGRWTNGSLPLTVPSLRMALAMVQFRFGKIR